MRREQRPWMRQQARLDPRRPIRARPVLHFEDISRIAAERSVFESISHGDFLDHRSASDIDEQRAGFHALERVAADQMNAIWSERDGQDQIIAVRKGTRQIGRDNPRRRLFARINPEEAAAEAGETRCDRPADSAQPHNPDDGLVEPHTIEDWPPALECAGAHEGVSVAQFSPQPKRQRDGKLRRRIGEKVRNYRDPHACRRASCDVEIVEALERACDHLQLRARA